jgi:hypothetical protein
MPSSKMNIILLLTVSIVCVYGNVPFNVNSTEYSFVILSDTHVGAPEVHTTFQIQYNTRTILSRVTSLISYDINRDR